MPTVATTPIVKTITVNASQDRAFDVFTRGIGSWWPLGDHSLGEHSAISVEMECRLGGRIVERYSARGSEPSIAAWGEILAWEPPARLAFSWYPGREGETPTEIEVSFSSLSGDQTRVVLEHRGWERMTPERLETRPSYVSGWEGVLAAYSTTASR